jgi:hypothetical protein
MASSAPGRAELRDHLVRTMIAGEVATPRQNNLLHYRRLAARNPYYMLGLDLKPTWTEQDVFDVMVERCGIDPDPRHLYGDDTIDPELTMDALEAMGERIGQAARRRETVILATGHPATLTPIYQEVAKCLREAGCAVLTPAEGWSYVIDTGYGVRKRRRIVYAPGGVAMLAGNGGNTHHSHDPHGMEAMLAELAAKSSDWPDLAIADHGWAGAAGEAGIDTVGFADCNDPALFAGAAEGKIKVVVPLDDGVSPHHYAPLTAYILDKAGLA